MFKDFEVCPHCEAKGFVRRHSVPKRDTLWINRSDGFRFHLELFSIDPVRKPNGEITPDQLLCDFRWVHDAVSGGTPIISLVTLSNPGPRGERALEQAELAADLLAQTLERESRLGAEYEIDGYALTTK